MAPSKRLTVEDIPKAEGEFIERMMAERTGDLSEPTKAIACGTYFIAWLECLEYQRGKERAEIAMHLRARANFQGLVERKNRRAEKAEDEVERLKERVRVAEAKFGQAACDRQEAQDKAARWVAKFNEANRDAETLTAQLEVALGILVEFVQWFKEYDGKAADFGRFRFVAAAEDFLDKTGRGDWRD